MRVMVNSAMPNPPINLAVLVSGSGRTLQNLIDLIGQNQLQAHIGLVIGSRPGIQALQRASDAKIPNFVIGRKGHDSVQSFSKSLFSLIDDAKIDLICLAGWLCLLEVPEKYAARIMNIHPALLPSFGGRGMHGEHVHEAVLAAGCKVSGCTVHFLDANYDTGPIILQRCCPVLEGDTADTLAARVFEEEKIAYPEAIRLFSEQRLKIDGHIVRVSGPQQPAAI